MSEQLRLAASFPTHATCRKLHRIAGHAGTWSFFCLLMWASTQPDTNGALGPLSERQIATLSQWEGDTPLLPILVQAGAVVVDAEENVTVHEWRSFFPADASSGQRRAMPARPLAVTTVRRDRATLPVAVTSPPAPAPKPRNVEQVERSADAPAPPPIPFQQIIATYHKTLPELPTVRVISEATKGQIRARWKEDKLRQNIEWWEDYFGYVKRCPFLLGKSPSVGDRTPFIASFGWLVGPQNMEKVINGQYEA